MERITGLEPTYVLYSIIIAIYCICTVGLYSKEKKDKKAAVARIILCVVKDSPTKVEKYWKWRGNPSRDTGYHCEI